MFEVVVVKNRRTIPVTTMEYKPLVRYADTVVRKFPDDVSRPR